MVDPPLRTLLVDDHPMIRAGGRQLLLHAFTTALVGEAGSARESLAAVMNER